MAENRTLSENWILVTSGFQNDRGEIGLWYSHHMEMHIPDDIPDRYQKRLSACSHSVICPLENIPYRQLEHE